jgi:DNA-binding transcriptional LysR family regulator
MADRFRTAADWEDVRFFAALARHGGLSATARALAVNHSTVARRVAGLERALGVTLIERRPNGYRLTAAGRDALTAAAAMEAAAQNLPQAGQADPAAGLVRITATSSLADAFLIPRLAAFRARHPAIDIELIIDRRVVSLARREADLALRLSRPDDGDLIARRIVALGFGFYANADWQGRLAGGADPVFVGFDESSAHLPEAVWLARHFPDRRLVLRANSQTSQASAARAGHGIALLPHFLGRADPTLTRIFLAEAPPPREIWLLARREAAASLPIKLARDFLIELFRGERALFEAD